MSTEPIKDGHHIVKYSAPTRFGQPGGPDPSAAGKRAHQVYGSRVGVRDALRRLSRLELKVGRIPTYDELAKEFGSRDLTMGEATAVRIFRDALAGSAKAQKQILDQVDGPLPKVAVKVETSLADLVAQARKELRDESASNRQH